MNNVYPSFSAMRTSEALRLGMTPAKLRGPAFERVGHGLVKLAGTDESHDLGRISVATGLMSPGCTLGGWASLRVQGNSWFDGIDRGLDRAVLVHCMPGAQLRRRDGVEPFRGLLHPDEIISLEHYDVTTMARGAFDEMRIARNVREAVVAFDMSTSTTAHVPHTTGERIGHVLAAHHKVRGLVQVRNALGLGSTRSASPWETRTRLLVQLDAGIARLAVNVPLFGLTGKLLGIADLLDEAAGLVIESDGADHREAERHTKDNRREEGFERVGLVVSRLTALDHRDRRETVARIISARRDAFATIKKEWTTEKPDWWWSWPAARQWD